MKAFNEKCDKVLQVLNERGKIKWETFTEATHINQNDGILFFLKNHKEFIDYDNNSIEITSIGKDFCKTTSFVQQRDG